MERNFEEPEAAHGEGVTNRAIALLKHFKEIQREHNKMIISQAKYRLLVIELLGYTKHQFTCKLHEKEESCDCGLEQLLREVADLME